MVSYVAFALALSIDALTAAFAYGNGRVQIKWSRAVMISVICSLILLVSLGMGKLLVPWISDTAGNIVCFIILLLLGLVKLFDYFIKSLIRRNKVIQSSFGFSFASLHFILNIYADPIEADCDQSKTLSVGEAVSLAVALSIDGLAAGFGFGVGGGHIHPVIIIGFLTGILALKLGELLGSRLAKKTDLDLSFLGGLILIILACTKLWA